MKASEVFYSLLVAALFLVGCCLGAASVAALFKWLVCLACKVFGYPTGIQP